MVEHGLQVEYYECVGGRSHLRVTGDLQNGSGSMSAPNERVAKNQARLAHDRAGSSGAPNERIAENQAGSARYGMGSTSAPNQDPVGAVREPRRE